MSKVVIISTSLRPGSNSHMMAEQFAASIFYVNEFPSAATAQSKD